MQFIHPENLNSQTHQLLNKSRKHLIKTMITRQTWLQYMHVLNQRCVLLLPGVTLNRVKHNLDHVDEKTKNTFQALCPFVQNVSKDSHHTWACCKNRISICIL